MAFAEFEYALMAKVQALGMAAQLYRPFAIGLRTIFSSFLLLLGNSPDKTQDKTVCLGYSALPCIAFEIPNMRGFHLTSHAEVKCVIYD